MQRSEQVGDLVAALAKAQLEFTPALKSTTNTFFNSKYADLAANIDAVRPALNKHGIALVQLDESDLERQVAIVTTMLCHGEQYIAHTIEAPAVGSKGFNVQSLGAAWTYLRRYGLQAICGLASEDDDGNSVAVDAMPVANRDKAKDAAKPVPKPAPRQASEADVRGRFIAAAATHGWTEPDALAYLASEHPGMKSEEIPMPQLKAALEAMAEESPISYFGSGKRDA